MNHNETTKKLKKKQHKAPIKHWFSSFHHPLFLIRIRVFVLPPFIQHAHFRSNRSTHHGRGALRGVVIELVELDLIFCFRFLLNFPRSTHGCFLKWWYPKSSILIGISIINHPFWGTPIFGNTHIISIIIFNIHFIFIDDK